MGLHMDNMCALNGELTPMEAAVLHIDAELAKVMNLVRDIKDQVETLEDACKTMRNEMKAIKKTFNLKG